ncbi:type II toxin-antitoxin system PemK/MazF family toxin [Thermoactinomyces daqus]|uniref:Type II toxin-antitoxin system PemK/MazF family toxin n=1 Tax=Thermoactinomyces daqus TaxID=1329516 RepID=A0A7W1X8E2_9BACL|nr:type II toxin-antitoxin system PemK/MazF family toxin [Thermoactinomyces daqus]MBA4541990.1 type II toxin-antitoxin system PemK/MazF family toxin [Thermoactinomyces daqus]
MKQNSQLSKVAELADLRSFPFGSVWIIGDEEISFPANRENRKLHKNRWVVIVSNNSLVNNDPTCFTVTVAPLTSKWDYKDEIDVELFVQNETSIEKNSIVRLTQMQPVLKQKLQICKGELSDDAKDELLAVLADYFGYIGDIDEEDYL